jgi:carbonic anhydrase
VLADLLSGNKRFYQQKVLHPDQSLTRRAALASGQKPKAIILSCSDSRVPPEIIFDQGLGNLFVVRTAGEVADSVALASIEYAVEHLGSSLLLVLGHESCGAVKATLETPAKQSAGSKHLDFLLSQIRPNIGTGKGQHGESPLDRAVRENVAGVAAALLKKSTIIAHAVAHNKLMIAQGVYQLSSGRVEVWF